MGIFQRRFTSVYFEDKRIISEYLEMQNFFSRQQKKPLQKEGFSKKSFPGGSDYLVAVADAPVTPT